MIITHSRSIQSKERVLRKILSEYVSTHTKLEFVQENFTLWKLLIYSPTGIEWLLKGRPPYPQYWSHFGSPNWCQFMSAVCGTLQGRTMGRTAHGTRGREAGWPSDGELSFQEWAHFFTFSSGRSKILRIENELFATQPEGLTCRKSEKLSPLDDAILLTRCGYSGCVK